MKWSLQENKLEISKNTKFFSLVDFTKPAVARFCLILAPILLILHSILLGQQIVVFWPAQPVTADRNGAVVHLLNKMVQRPHYFGHPEWLTGAPIHFATHQISTSRWNWAWFMVSSTNRAVYALFTVRLQNITRKCPAHRSVKCLYLTVPDYPLSNSPAKILRTSLSH